MWVSVLNKLEDEQDKKTNISGKSHIMPEVKGKVCDNCLREEQLNNLTLTDTSIGLCIQNQYLLTAVFFYLFKGITKHTEDRYKNSK